MRHFESVLTRGLVVAVVCMTAGIAAPGSAEEMTHGTGKVADTSGIRVMDSPPVTIAEAPTSLSSDASPAEPASGRLTLAQPGCTICLGGLGSLQWNGSSGSFHVDTINNYRGSGVSGSLDLRVALTSSFPVYGQTLNYFSFSDSYSLGTLAAGYMFSNVNSGTIPYHGNSIPSGLYWALLYLREYQGGGVYQYNDWIVMDNLVSCNGSGCSVVSSCTEDTYTMCLVNGRYRVTSHWKNQYAGGAVANLSKAKLTNTTGAFWIADANTYEYLIRFNTASTNGRVWIAIPTFTDVEFWVAVTDTVGGQSKEYHSNAGNQTLIYDPYFFVYP